MKIKGIAAYIMWVVADIGGTNTRVATVKKFQVNSFVSIPTKSISDVGKFLRDHMGEENIEFAIVGCAGPVEDGLARLTHADVVVDEKTLSDLLGTKVRVVNDAVMASASLISSQLREGRHLFVTIGTDVGVSLVLKNSGKYGILPTEFTHILEVFGIHHMSVKSSNMLSLCNLNSFSDAELSGPEEFEPFNKALNHYLAALILAYLPQSITLYGRVFNYPVAFSMDEIHNIIGRTNVSVTLPRIRISSDEMLPILGGVNLIRNISSITFS